MVSPPQKVRALALLSGGLDSTLAIHLLQQQDIEVTGLAFVTPFFGAKNAEAAAQRLQIPLIVRDISTPHFEIVKNPAHGYGQQMNPCIDCHGFMFRIAGEILRSEGFDIVSTGEVLGQRPMSQNRRALDVVEALADLPQRILRPLSAQLLPPTIPETDGRIDRSRLLDISGKSRRRQMDLAHAWGIVDYPTPAGGCLLTDPDFTRRLRELFAHEKTPELTDVPLLKMGRVLFVGTRSLIVLGRNEPENTALETFSHLSGDTVVSLRDLSGPTALLRVNPPDTHDVLLPAVYAAIRQFAKAARATEAPLAFTLAGSRSGEVVA